MLSVGGESNIILLGSLTDDTKFTNINVLRR